MPAPEVNRSPREWLTRKPNVRVRLVTGVIASLMLTMTCVLWHLSVLYLNLPLRTEAQLQRDLITERLTAYFRDHLRALRILTGVYSMADPAGERRRFGIESISQYLSEREFQRISNTVLGLQPAPLAIMLLDTDGIPVWVAPETSLLPLRDLYDPHFIGMLGGAVNDAQEVISDPISLPMFGRGVMAAVPVLDGRRHLGFIVSVIQFQTMLLPLIDAEALINFHVTIHENDEQIYPFTTVGIPTREGAEADLWEEAGEEETVLLGRQEWTVRVIPRRSAMVSPFNHLSVTLLGLGLCLSLMGTYWIHRILWRAVRLQREAVDQRSRLERTGHSLAEVRAQLDLIMNSVDEGIVLYDAELAPVQVNGAFLTMFQLTADSEAVHDARSHHRTLVRMLGRETRYWAMFESLKRDPVRAWTDEIEAPLPHDDKIRRARVYLRRAVALTDAREEIHGMLVIFKDVTMIKDIERVKDEFLSNVTHELRSPLASIKGFAEMIHRDQAMPAETREEFISIICEESARLQHLIEELLDLRRLQSQGMPLRITPYDLRELVDNVVHAARSVAHAKQIKLEVAWTGLDNTRLRGDVTQISRAIRNLITNAIKYSPAGGVIQVTGRVGLQRIALEVTDQGTGIEEKDLPYIFDQFYRGTSQGRQKGTGLGLAIVKHTIELHGGHLGVRSEVGRGTSFRIELPREFETPKQAGQPGGSEALRRDPTATTKA